MCSQPSPVLSGPADLGLAEGSEGVGCSILVSGGRARDEGGEQVITTRTRRVLMRCKRMFSLDQNVIYFEHPATGLLVREILLSTIQL